jgi:type I restriction enzyme S subunit
MVALRADPDAVYPPYLFAALRSDLVQNAISNMHVGTLIPHFKKGDFDKLFIPLPERQTQHFIGDLYLLISQKVDLNRRMNETLEAMARAIFKDWFVDFGPTRAKMKGLAPYLAPEIWALFPERLDGEGKPEGWRVDPLLMHARLLSGGTPKTDVGDYWNGPVLWARAKDVSRCDEVFLTRTERTITERGLSESATQIVPINATVVVARGATTGRFCMFGAAMAMNQTCYALTSKRPFWLNCAFGTLVQSLVHAAHGSVFDTITMKTIEGAKVVVATDDVMEHFETLVAPSFASMRSHIEESLTLGETRDALLHKLMSGEIRIRDAEKVVEAVA